LINVLDSGNKNNEALWVNVYVINLYIFHIEQNENDSYFMSVFVLLTNTLKEYQDPYLQGQGRTCSFKVNIAYLRVYVVSGP
jgi:hypothetical protein